jgi:transcriptional regulator with XRE-family HTH domain
MSDLRARLLSKFRDPEYRHEYLESFLDSLVTGQIRELRESRGWSQEDLAKKLKTTQSAISRLESPSYFKWKIDTLKKLARAFDMAFVGKFVSFGDALDDIEHFGLDKLARPDFSHDPVFNEQAPDNQLESEARASRANKVVAFERPEKLELRIMSSSSPSTPTAEYKAASGG